MNHSDMLQSNRGGTINKVIKRLLIGLAVVAGLAVFLLLVGFAVAGPGRETPLRYVIPGLLAGFGAFFAGFWVRRRIHRRNDAIVAEHPGALVFAILPFQAVRDAIAAVADASGSPRLSPRYGSARPLVIIDETSVAVRMDAGAPPLVQVPVSSIIGLTTREVKVGVSRFPTIELALRMGDRDLVLPLPPAKAADPTMKPSLAEFEALVTNVRTAIRPGTE